MSESEPVTPTITDAPTDSVELFAADLRKLRVGAENPTYSRLHNEGGVSRSVLSEAFAGRQLPSARTVEGIVRVCRGDVDAWLDRREALAGGSKLPDSEAPAAVDSAATVRRRTALLLAAGCFVLGATIAATTTALIVGNVPEPEPDALATTGENPAATPCVDDAAVATSEARAGDALLEILWSDKCQAGWGRITRYDGLSDQNAVTIAIYPEPAPNGPDRQEAIEHDVQSAYTNIIVRPTPDTLLCVEGSFTVRGDVTELGAPLCI